jgi:hypothetical protein
VITVALVTAEVVDAVTLHCSSSSIAGG